MAFFSLENIKQVIRKSVNVAGNFRGIPSRIRAKHEARLRPKFERLKSRMIKEFLRHPITKEIQRGPKLGSGNNPSGTLGGYGDLFSFIGFNRDDDPIQKILDELLETRLDHVKTTMARSDYRVNFPSEEEIIKATPLPWADNFSWAEKIERGGIPGLGQYLNKKYDPGRSGSGIQLKLKYDLRDPRSKETPYILSILAKYKDKFASIS